MSSKIQRLLVFLVSCNTLSVVVLVLASALSDEAAYTAVGPVAALSLLPFLAAAFLGGDLILGLAAWGIGKERLSRADQFTGYALPFGKKEPRICVLWCFALAIAAALLLAAIRQLGQADLGGAVFLLLQTAHVEALYVLYAAAMDRSPVRAAAFAED